MNWGLENCSWELLVHQQETGLVLNRCTSKKYVETPTLWLSTRSALCIFLVIDAFL